MNNFQELTLEEMNLINGGGTNVKPLVQADDVFVSGFIFIRPPQ